jgi:hypothetical protein
MFIANVIVQKKITNDAEPRNICLKVNESNEVLSNPEGNIQYASTMPITIMTTLVFI